MIRIQRSKKHKSHKKIKKFSQKITSIRVFGGYIGWRKKLMWRRFIAKLQRHNCLRNLTKNKNVLQFFLRIRFLITFNAKMNIFSTKFRISAILFVLYTVVKSPKIRLNMLLLIKFQIGTFVSISFGLLNLKLYCRHNNKSQKKNQNKKHTLLPVIPRHFFSFFEKSHSKPSLTRQSRKRKPSKSKIDSTSCTILPISVE